jgi:hypothetical protein
MYKRILIITFSVLLSLVSFAQETKVKGKVLVFDSIPVVNANVMIYSSKATVKTDHQGVFECTCQAKDKLIVTADGFSKYTFRVKKKKKKDIMVGNIRLAKIPKAKDIAIERGHVLMVEQFEELVKKNSGVKDYSRFSSMMDVIKNEYPSLQIVNGEIIIRGPSSLKGSSAAQIEIDGVMQDYSALVNLSPTNVANIKVIKGSDAAIYGVRGGTGVISITTKKGNE